MQGANLTQCRLLRTRTSRNEQQTLVHTRLALRMFYHFNMLLRKHSKHYISPLMLYSKQTLRGDCSCFMLSSRSGSVSPHRLGCCASSLRGSLENTRDLIQDLVCFLVLQASGLPAIRTPRDLPLLPLPPFPPFSLPLFLRYSYFHKPKKSDLAVAVCGRRWW